MISFIQYDFYRQLGFDELRQIGSVEVHGDAAFDDFCPVLRRQVDQHLLQRGEELLPNFRSRSASGDPKRLFALEAADKRAVLRGEFHKRFNGGGMEMVNLALQFEILQTRREFQIAYCQAIRGERIPGGDVEIFQLVEFFQKALFP